MQGSILRRSLATVGVIACGVALTACASNSEQAKSIAELDGTVWCSPNVHSRVAVDFRGNVEVKDGKDVCLAFAQNSGSYVVKIDWWNESKAIHLVEWAIAIQTSESTLVYMEAGHAGNPDFIGVAGEGEIEMSSNDSMTLMQVGNLIDGSAAGFITELDRVAQMPEIPVPVTYPLP
jgi:hypothetical protein